MCTILLCHLREGGRVSGKGATLKFKVSIGSPEASSAHNLRSVVPLLAARQLRRLKEAGSCDDGSIMVCWPSPSLTKGSGGQQCREAYNKRQREG
jgi:hypothetical protein